MKKTFKIFNYFTKTEVFIWLISIILISVSFLFFDRVNYIIYIVSLIGVTALIFIAKGNPLGQILMLSFCIVYGIISYKSSYYGEMITYFGLTAPMALVSLFSWLKNPYKGKKSEVKVNIIEKKEIILIVFLAILITFVFYFVLKYFSTSNIVVSTFSVTTSFIAVYLTFRRSPFYAIAYAANDVVLIILWGMASFEDLKYLSIVICFLAFLINDIYGFISWNKMYKRQNS